MIKVLVIETTMFGYDGITNVITNYYSYQNHQRIKMDLVTINPVSDRFKHELDLNGSINYVLPYRNHNPIKYIAKLVKIIKNGKYKIVHVHGCSATMAVEMLAAKLAGVKVRIAHSHNTKCDHVKADKILRPFFACWCNYGFACGKEAGEWMFPGKKFKIISNGIDLEKFQFNPEIRNKFRRKFGLDGKLVIGHVGRFSEQKNHAKLIDIFEKLSQERTDVKLALVGDGELRDEIEQRTKASKLDVLFVGLSDEVECWLQTMDIIVFPSLFEGLPLGLVEAQAAGLPCILSSTISEMTKITDLVQFVNLDAGASEWCGAIIKTAGKFDRAERNESVKAKIRKEHFDIRQNCEELALLYEKLVRKEYYKSSALKGASL